METIMGEAYCMKGLAFIALKIQNGSKFELEISNFIRKSTTSFKHIIIER